MDPVRLDDRAQPSRPQNVSCRPDPGRQTRDPTSQTQTLCQRTTPDGQCRQGRSGLPPGATRPSPAAHSTINQPTNHHQLSLIYIPARKSQELFSTIFPPPVAADVRRLKNGFLRRFCLYPGPRMPARKGPAPDSNLTAKHAKYAKKRGLINQ